jgi:hypothetical protein
MTFPLVAGRSDVKFWRYMRKADDVVEVLLLFHV